MNLDKRTPIFAANWKMNKKVSETLPFLEELAESLAPIKDDAIEVVVVPPATHLSVFRHFESTFPIQWGAQNCGTAASGAFTAEISPAVLKELGCRWVILGHSERRHVFHENAELIQSRFKAALGEHLRVIYCVGEKLDERKAGKTLSVVENQLSTLKSVGLSAQDISTRCVVAYEPVWAIGTGETATPEQAQEVHKAIRGWVKTQFSAEAAQSLRIQYGGSVKPGNASELMKQSDIDGFLVGGASLEADIFFQVIKNGLESEPS